MAQVVELGRLRELTLKGSLAYPTSISWNCTSSIMEISARELVRIHHSSLNFCCVKLTILAVVYNPEKVEVTNCIRKYLKGSKTFD